MPNIFKNIAIYVLKDLHQKFLENHWRSFEDCEENKLEYMDIFMEYTAIFESHLVKQLDKLMENFDMQQFAEELE